MGLGCGDIPPSDPRARVEQAAGSGSDTPRASGGSAGAATEPGSGGSNSVGGSGTNPTGGSSSEPGTGGTSSSGGSGNGSAGSAGADTAGAGGSTASGGSGGGAGSGSAGADSGSPVASVHQSCNYGGWKAELAVGRYALADLVKLGGKDNDASSVKVSAGYEVVLYDSDNFAGSMLAVSVDSSCLSGASFNDKVSSLEVRAK